jgi:hypothetical protein
MSETRLTIEEQAALKARQLMEVSRKRYFALSECLNIVNATVRNFSKNENGLEPKPGYEEAYRAEHDKADTIRGMMREIRADCGW